MMMQRDSGRPREQALPLRPKYTRSPISDSSALRQNLPVHSCSASVKCMYQKNIEPHICLVTWQLLMSEDDTAAANQLVVGGTRGARKLGNMTTRALAVSLRQGLESDR